MIAINNNLNNIKDKYYLMDQIDLTKENILSYQTDFICTYKLIDEEFTDDLYQVQLLQAFNLEKWEDIVINSLCFELYTLLTNSNIVFRDIIEKAKHNTDIKNIYDSVIDKDGEDDDKIIFTLLFTYEYFDLFHKCICEYMRNGKVSFQTLENLMIKL
jgi:hypothetical protein